MRFFLALLLLALAPSAAFAACSSPTGTAGEIVFNADSAVVQYCDGTNWISFGKGPASTLTNVQPPSSGLIGHWKLDDGAGTTAIDSVGSNNGTLTNGPTWTTGKIGGAVSFDGTNDYISAGSAASLDDLSNFTYAAWIYPYTLGEGVLKGIIMQKSGGGGNKEFTLNDAVGNNFRVYIETNSVAVVGNTGLNTVDLNRWQHVVLTYDDGTKTATIYKDGVSLGSFTGAGTLVSEASGDLLIGNDPGASRSFDGLIDDVRIYNRALSASEVSSLYYAGAGLSGPVAYWKLDETSGNTVADSAGGYTGTWQYTETNNPVPGIIGNAMQSGWARTINTAGPITEIDNASQASLSLWMRRSAAGQEERVGQGLDFES